MSKISVSILAILLSALPASAQPIIETVVGNFSLAGDAATQVPLGEPWGAVVDASGNLYITATYLQCVLKIDSVGTTSVVAGVMVPGYSGDGGPATSAQLADPIGVAVDGAGNLFIADRNNHRIRKVDTAGIITTVAGNGFHGYSGDGGPASSAQLYQPYGVAVDGAGNLLIVDRGNQRIRKVDTAGIITTVAGNGSGGYSGDGGPATSAQLAWPLGVAADGAGNLFIADSQNYRIRKVDTAGIITTVAGTGSGGYSGDGGPATSAKLGYPHGVAVDGAGNLFIADTQNSRIRKVDTAGIITTVAGSACGGYSGDGGPATSAQLAVPHGVAVDGAGNLFIADSFNHRIRKVDGAGVITTVAGNGFRHYFGEGIAGIRALLYYPYNVAVDAAGNLFIADRDNHRIRKVDTTGIITTVAGNGFRGGSGDGGPATSAKLNYPHDVAVDGAGNLFIADSTNARIRKVDTAGIITTVAGSHYGGYSGDGGPATNAQLRNPLGVTVDGAGNLFIADSFNHRIRKVDTAGIITTVAGNGSGGYSGDGGPATSAQLYYPHEHGCHVPHCCIVCVVS